MYVRSSKTRVIAVRVWMTSKLLERNRLWLPVWKKLVKNVDHCRIQLHFLITCIFGMYSTWMQTEWNYFWTEYSKDVWITYFCWSNCKNYRDGQSFTHKTVAWSDEMEGHASKMRRTILWIGKEGSGAVIQSVKSLLGWSSIRTGRTRISRRIITNLLTNCLEMLSFGTNWETRHSVVCQQTCKSSHKNGLRHATDDWQDWFHSFIYTNEFQQYCHVGNTAQQCRQGLFHDSDFVGDFEDSKSTSVEVLCIFGSHTSVPLSWMCKKQTSVSHSSTGSEIISLDAGLRMDGLLALDLWDMVIEVLRSTNNNARQGRFAQRDLCGTGDHFINKKRPKHQLKRERERLSDCQIWIMCPRTHILLKASPSCSFLKTTWLTSRWSPKDEVQQWDMFPEPTELRLIGCSTESTWK